MKAGKLHDFTYQHGFAMNNEETQQRRQYDCVKTKLLSPIPAKTNDTCCAQCIFERLMSFPKMTNCDIFKFRQIERRIRKQTPPQHVSVFAMTVDVDGLERTVIFPSLFAAVPILGKGELLCSSAPDEESDTKHALDAARLSLLVPGYVHIWIRVVLSCALECHLNDPEGWPVAEIAEYLQVLLYSDSINKMRQRSRLMDLIGVKGDGYRELMDLLWDREVIQKPTNSDAAKQQSMTMMHAILAIRSYIDKVIGYYKHPQGLPMLVVQGDAEQQALAPMDASMIFVMTAVEQIKHPFLFFQAEKKNGLQ